MRKIKLGSKRNGRPVYTLVDDEDYESLPKTGWKLTRAYVTRSIRGEKVGKRKYKWTGQILHRVILSAKQGEIVDHIDFNPLNNQKRNLRICNAKQNAYHKRSNGSKSGFRGVVKIRGRWFAKIGSERIIYALGGYSTPEEAARAYNKKALELHGEFAVLNEVHGKAPKEVHSK